MALPRRLLVLAGAIVFLDAQVRPAVSNPDVRFGLWLMFVFGAGFGATETLGPLQLAAVGLGGLGIAATFLGAIAVETTLAPLVDRLTE